MSASNVWGRKVKDEGAQALSKNAFMGLVTLFMFSGIAVAALFAGISYDWNVDAWPSWGFVLFMLGVLAAAIYGGHVYEKYDVPVISAIGYVLVAGPFGLLIGPLLHMYSPEATAKALMISLAVVGVLGLIGTIVPQSLESWRPYLLGALIVLLIGLVAVPFLGLGAMHLWDWVGLVVFGALVVFDFNRASRMERTLDNAIDAAATIFMDFINIFLRVLSLGKS